MKKYLVTGLVILLPLAVTIAIVVFIVDFLTKPFIGIVSGFLQDMNLLNKGFLFLTPEQVVLYGSKLLILLCLVLFTFLLGMIARWFFFKALINLSDKILHRIPLVNKVYKTTQEIIKTIFVTDKSSFKQVVMVPFPKGGSYVMGLVSRESPKVCCEGVGEELYSVLVPTTPNPTTGFLLMYKKEEMIFLDLKPEQAIKYIVSCGVITPEHPTQIPEEPAP
ncbi:DUF502 domain-containing protein [Candidatus Neptunochlamydia vexilliferae]|uniref:DUF502 domain-containing protein n=1 Tax=Candidatus Neptunichlamydia vexilliferae TaxID=1651774 RepID=A0ABS0B0N0_9BACT|nr:DUF502 domain-containing protein [Candidatus Neptunochlamydia vexilliferae]MBF5059256.1 hypothetical protein [Candidatus Neptunochlamydia vexilliferae]